MSHQTQTTYEDALKVLRILNEAGYVSRFAGGCVRDRLMGITPKDYDIASAAVPETALNLFAKMHLRVIPTGIEHGTVTVMMPSGPVEVTTLRRDVQTDGRHAVVSFDGASFETDAARRDFTINAMFEDEHGNIYDYFNGRNDLRLGVLKFVGNPKDRICEDYLRTLRYFRFWARYGFNPDQSALDAISDTKQSLTILSRERISSELRQILLAKNLTNVWPIMESTGVTAILWPEFPRTDQAMILAIGALQTFSDDIRYFASIAVLTDLARKTDLNDATIRQFCHKQRWSEYDASTLIGIYRGYHQLQSPFPMVAAALEFASTIESIAAGRSLMQFYGPVWSFLATQFNDPVRLENLSRLLANDQAFGFRRRNPMPLNGHDIQEAFPDLRGKDVGNLLHRVKIGFLNGEWQSRTEGLVYLRNITQTSETSD
jgi:tRNA nucleotidyltransferase/poly(A) polymerase